MGYWRRAEADATTWLAWLAKPPRQICRDASAVRAETPHILTPWPIGRSSPINTTLRPITNTRNRRNTSSLPIGVSREAGR